MEPFKGTEIPILVVPTNVDEFCLMNIGQYKGKKFVNVESDFEEIKKNENIEKQLPEEDVSSFCLWLKNELSHSINKVILSKRLSDLPGLVVGPMSSSMRMIQ